MIYYLYLTKILYYKIFICINKCRRMFLCINKKYTTYYYTFFCLQTVLIFNESIRNGFSHNT
ncbi:hypothetical protein TBC1_111091 [Lentimicrobium saccharophilum]|uniref:Uncharacterized protein n=1 Tax=Lentimicrobium saccharophilum TaxID=1678841 RepID=A0A0S7C0V6_9BACT|nr:hypothetical protein TBC1_111091 [Lentimicrobium saccharophilum]